MRPALGSDCSIRQRKEVQHIPEGKRGLENCRKGELLGMYEGEMAVCEMIGRGTNQDVLPLLV